MVKAHGLCSLHLLSPSAIVPLGTPNRLVVGEMNHHVLCQHLGLYNSCKSKATQHMFCLPSIFKHYSLPYQSQCIWTLSAYPKHSQMPSPYLSCTIRKSQSGAWTGRYCLAAPSAGARAPRPRTHRAGQSRSPGPRRRDPRRQRLRCTHGDPETLDEFGGSGAGKPLAGEGALAASGPAHRTCTRTRTAHTPHCPPQPAAASLLGCGGPGSLALAQQAERYRRAERG
ncbi:uncharacterized protein LOC132533837 [Erinaceus europaeus]|uniref:Uncharacterized protein LOC132533837 n=1 Tax=Erinaceus europaeus TaxID=9365 RepID=A0ABM3W778_ERIEU|nr:uncharacterized protein LOC132533837 [Erinaceus europaeus]